MNNRLILNFYLIFLIFSRVSAQSDKNTNAHKAQKKVAEQSLNHNANGKESLNGFVPAEGKIISKINIKIINVSGPSVESDSGFQSTFFGSIANTLHFESREWVARNMLLFNPGDSLDAEKVSESERLLRSSGFFLDAKIKLRKHPVSRDSIIVDVVSQDRWTFTPLLSYNPKSEGFYFGIRDDNFIGLGHTIYATASYDQDPLKGSGGIIKYTAVNVAGSFINPSVYLETNKSITTKSISFQRPYLSTEIEWVGGLDLTAEHGRYEFFNNQSDIESYSYSFNAQDIWLGKSYSSLGTLDFLKNKILPFSSIRIYRTNYSKRPSPELNAGGLFENYVLYLLNLGVIRQKYYKDVYLGGFGVTEDVPVGGIISGTAGYEKRENTNRWYAGIRLIFSDNFKDIGYLSASLGLDGFRNINKWEQETLNLNLLYHSPLISFDKWKVRFLASNDYLYGYNRFRGEQIYLDNENGMRGFNSYSVFGTKKITLNTEALLFSPYSLLGFKLGAVAFADFGVIAPDDKNIFSGKLYQGYGFGARINNESIARAGFQISLVYNPVLPLGGGDIKIQFSGNFILGSRPFGFDKPSVIKFNGTR
jgi:hypothetical protein